QVADAAPPAVKQAVAPAVEPVATAVAATHVAEPVDTASAAEDVVAPVAAVVQSAPHAVTNVARASLEGVRQVVQQVEPAAETPPDAEPEPTAEPVADTVPQPVADSVAEV